MNKLIGKLLEVVILLLSIGCLESRTEKSGRLSTNEETELEAIQVATSHGINVSSRTIRTVVNPEKRSKILNSIPSRSEFQDLKKKLSVENFVVVEFLIPEGFDGGDFFVFFDAPGKKCLGVYGTK